MAAYIGTGLGTVGSPYLITTWLELLDMMTCDGRLTSYWKLGNDIDAADSSLIENGAGWIPVGEDFGNPFSGNFDGDGHTISNLYCVRDIDAIGLFGSVTGTVTKLYLTDLMLIGDYAMHPVAGGICALLFGGTISLCYTTGTISVTSMGITSATVGGLVGDCEGTIENCYSTVNVSAESNGTKYLGGLVGNANPESYDVAITYCYSVGVVGGTGTYIGGFCGKLGSATAPYYNTATITSCYYDSTTSGQSDIGKGTGTTTANMYKEATFVNWDFADIWTIVENTSYPTFATVTDDGVVESDINYRQALVAIGNGEVWYESTAGTMTKLAASSGALQSGVPIAAVPAFGKVFIADGVVKKVVDFVNTKLTVTAMAILPDRGAILGQATSGAQMVVDYCTSTTIYGATIVGTFNTANAVAGGGMTSSIPSAVDEPTIPHWYDWKVYPKGYTGALPEFVNIMCLYRGRIMMNNLQNPYMWSMTRQDNPFDCLYMMNDDQTPVSGQDGVLGLIGGIPTAFISYSDDYVIIGCVGEIDILRGDPAKGGELGPLFTSDGIFGPMSWCFDGMGNVYFMGLVGLYRMPQGGGIPEPLSNTRIPELMEGIDRDTHRITLGYDKEKNGIEISILTLADNTAVNWWYDLRTGGMFFESYGVGISAQLFYDATASDYVKLIAGCSDGYLRWWDKSKKNDQSVDDEEIPIDSKVVYGPLVLGDGDTEAMINNLFVSLGTDTDSVDWDIYVNDSAEELNDDLVNSGLFTGSFDEGGRQLNIRERARGAVFAIKFSNNTIDKTFAIEQVGIDILPGGKLRK